METGNGTAVRKQREQGSGVMQHRVFWERGSGSRSLSPSIKHRVDYREGTEAARP